jgi:general secretion pathway protein F
MKYKIIYQKDKHLDKITIPKSDLQHYLDNYAIVELKKIQSLKEYIASKILTLEQVIYLFSELSLILDSKISLLEAINILIVGNKIPILNDILLAMQNSITNGQPIYKSLYKFKNQIGIFPMLFFQIGEQNNTLHENIKSLIKVLKIIQDIKSKIVNILFYPMILFVSIIITFVFIFNFVLPRFSFLFEQLGDNIPLATQMLLDFHSFLQSNWLLLIAFFIGFIFTTKYAFKKYPFQISKIIFCNIPFISKLYQQFLFYELFLSLNILLKINYKFQDALKSSKIIITNQYLNYKLDFVITDIKNGVSAYQAFQNSQLLDPLITRLLYTATKTDNYIPISSKIEDIYYKHFRQSLDKMIRYILPISLTIAFSIILWIILAIMLPTLNMGIILK